MIPRVGAGWLHGLNSLTSVWMNMPASMAQELTAMTRSKSARSSKTRGTGVVEHDV
jgi:hypothetical protein